MNKKSRRFSTDRMIHVRLDEKMHRKLKMHTAASKGTIQQLVESLIRDKYARIQIKDVKP